jgi:hypothetical protein
MTQGSRHHDALEASNMNTLADFVRLLARQAATEFVRTQAIIDGPVSDDSQPCPTNGANSEQ